MSDRLTENWTSTAGEAFGESGIVGDAGEKQAIELLSSFGFTVIHHPSNKHLQISGVDITIISEDGEKYGIDVKTNLHKGKDVCVDYKKIHKSASMYWLHMNKNDPNDWIMYPVVKMANYVKDLTPYNNEYYWVPRHIADNLQ